MASENIDYEFMYNKATSKIRQLEKALKGRKGIGMENAVLKSKLARRDAKKERQAKQIRKLKAEIEALKNDR